MDAACRGISADTSHLASRFVQNSGYCNIRYRSTLMRSANPSENLLLSYRGSERQAPNALQLALRFSKVLDTRAEQGKHPKQWSTMERLTSVIERPADEACHGRGQNKEHLQHHCGHNFGAFHSLISYVSEVFSCIYEGYWVLRKPES